MHHIAYITDKGFFLPTAVSLASLAFHMSEGSGYTAHVVHVGLDGEQCERLKRIENIARENGAILHVEFVDASGALSSVWDRGFSRGRFQIWSPMVMLKCHLPDLLSCDRVLYVDGDTLFLSNPDALLELDLEGCPIAGGRDIPWCLTSSGRFGNVKPNHDYVNGGVWLMDLASLRGMNFMHTMVDTVLREKCQKLEQDALNIVFKDKIKYFDLRYNCMLPAICRNMIFEDVSLDCINKVCLKDYKKIDDILHDACIIHFATEKPWKVFNMPLADIWMQYFKKSPCADAILDRTVSNHLNEFPFSILAKEMLKKVLKRAKRIFLLRTGR